jgi:hypothetical protein
MGWRSALGTSAATGHYEESAIEADSNLLGIAIAQCYRT